MNIKNILIFYICGSNYILIKWNYIDLRRGSMEKAVMEVFNDNILDEAAQRFGVKITDLKFINDFENYIYEFERLGQYYILRLTHSSHRDENLVNGELDWIYYLHNNGSSACNPIFSENKKLVERINTEDSSYFLATAFEKAKGKHVKRDDEAVWNNALFEKWGQVVGRMHALTKNYKPSKAEFKRIEWDEDDLVINAESYLSRYGISIVEKQKSLVAWCNTLPKDKDSYGLIHTDVHDGNFFVHDGDMTVFDFDDCAYNWFINDIAIVLFYVNWGIPSIEIQGRKELLEGFFTNFLKGYRSENDIDSGWLECIPKFLKLREITVFAVLNKKWDLNNLTEKQHALLESLKNNIENNIPLVDLDFTRLA
jgi:amicoumacin kinase